MLPFFFVMNIAHKLIPKNPATPFYKIDVAG